MNSLSSLSSSALFDQGRQSKVPAVLQRLDEQARKEAPSPSGRLSFGQSLHQARTEAARRSAEVQPARKAPDAGPARGLADPERMVRLGIPSSRIAPQLNIEAEIKTSPQHRKLYEASQEMESMFVNLMLKEMRKNINKAKLIDGGRAEEIFEDMLYDEYSKKIAGAENMGLAESLYSQLSSSL